MACLKSSLRIILVVMIAPVLAGCGDDATAVAPKGSPENPLVAEPPADAVNEGPRAPGEARGTPGYADLLKRQARKPRERFSPCNLVTGDEARAILRAPVPTPIEAPQGPTCIYRSGDRQVTLTVQALGLDQVRKGLNGPRPVRIGDRAGVCGTEGQPTLHLRMSKRRVLSITAPCRLARQFAARAVPRL